MAIYSTGGSNTMDWVSNSPYTTRSVGDGSMLYDFGGMQWRTPTNTQLQSTNSGRMTGPAMPGREVAPTLSNYQFSQDTINQPYYMRALGENLAQGAFQNQVNQGISMGNAAQGYRKALMDRNNTRLSYMTQAGNAQMGVDQALAGQQNSFNQQLLALYGANQNQRGQDMDYLSRMFGYNVQQRGQDIQGSMGGGNQARVGGRMTSGGAPSVYKGLGGRTGYDINSPVANSGGGW